MKKVFIDGQAGTTGLVIREMLKKHKEIEVIEIEEQYRKDIDKKKELFTKADLVVLCLPDEAAIEAVKQIPQNVKVIDTSTAHRIADGWVYGFAEIKGQRDKIRKAMRVANPGCHSTGAISLIRPLIEVISNDYPLSITSLTGYSGGGRKKIEEYNARDKNDESWSVRPYALGMKHKHIPEVVALTGLKKTPLFYPVLGTLERGMLVSVGIEKNAKDIHNILKNYYEGEKFVKVLPFDDNPTEPLCATNCNYTNNLEIMAFGHETQTMAIARLDNLGKGASGAALQNMNIMLGFDEATGLE